MKVGTDSDTVLLGRLAQERWRSGLCCPRCNSVRCGLHMRSGAGGRRKFKCADCGRTFNDLTGTPFARSHLPLSLWFAAARHMAGRVPTCADLASKLDVKLATAWRVRRVLGAALRDPRLRKVLVSEVPASCA